MSEMTLEQMKNTMLAMCRNKDLINADKAFAIKIIRDRLSFIPHQKLYKFRPCEERHFSLLSDNFIWMPPASEFPDTLDCTIHIDSNNQELFKKWLHPKYSLFCYLMAKRFFENEEGFAIPFSESDLAEYVDSCLDDNNCPIEKREQQFLQTHARDHQMAEKCIALNKIKTFRDKLAAKEDEVGKGLVENVNEMQTQPRKTTLVYCMTESYDNNYFWKDYASDYSGFCIEYDFSKFDTLSFNEYKNLAYLFPMIYQDDIPDIDIIPIFDGAFHTRLLHDPSWSPSPESTANLNMQLYYKAGKYISEHEWRFSIRNENNSKQYFPFVSRLIAGYKISNTDYSKLQMVAEDLSVPLVRQIANKAGDGFDYV